MFPHDITGSFKSTHCTNIIYRNDPSLSATRKYIGPLTLPYEDPCGRIMQLWTSSSYPLIGTVLEKGRIHYISSSKIINPLNLHDTPQGLSERLQKDPLKKWRLVFDDRKLTLCIWPHMEAAGRYDKVPAEAVIKDAQKRINNLSYEGALNREHYTAAQQEAKGKLRIINPRDNQPYDHKNDVQNSQKAGKNLIEDLKGKLAQDRLSPHERKQIEKLISRTSKLLDDSKRLAPCTVKKPTNTPATRDFQKNVQAARLTSSYNTNHKQAPIPAKGASSGSIGGVASSAEYIEGLFDEICA